MNRPKSAAHTQLCVDAEGKTECVCGWYEESGQAWLDNRGTQPLNPKPTPHHDRDNITERDNKERAAEIARDRFKLRKDRTWL